MEKIPIQAIQEGIDAFRQIVILEQIRAKQRAKRVLIRQGFRGFLTFFSIMLGVIALNLILFWTTVALYQQGWSVGLLNSGIAIVALVVSGFFLMLAGRLGRTASWASILRKKNDENTRADREGTGERKKAA